MQNLADLGRNQLGDIGIKMIGESLVSKYCLKNIGIRLMKTYPKII